ncbi:MAG TPA: N,N-dimethylformamidase beta subunit family domain-containing protein [Candidatus Binataceae bacterium]|nr:N,N-dimethylformamidase beta subunit family domain-containing protein [Candidatus Binataceae bacterium]
MEVVGYCDKLSVFPGERIKFMVSVEDHSHYDVEIVRLIHGDTNPAGPGFKEQPIKTAASGKYPARKQEIHAGSYGLVPDSAALQNLDSFALQAMICPTTPGKGAQGIITKWDSARNLGYGLIIDESGCAALWLADGSGKVERLSSSKPLIAGSWYFVSAALQAGRMMVSQEPIAEAMSGRCAMLAPSDAAPAAVEKAISIGPLGANGAPLLIAGWLEHAMGSRLKVGGKYNGKIDRPRLARRPLRREAMDSPKPVDLIAGWDFAAGISRQGIPSRNFTDLSFNGLHGTLINQPTRAVTGYNWTSEEQNFIHVPAQYGAIHFHDDDLHDAGWETDFELLVPVGLKSGIYAARLRAGDEEDYIPFYVRPLRGKESRIALLAPTASYMAYANDHLTTNSSVAQLMIARNPVMQRQDLFLAQHREYGLSTYDTHSDGSGVAYSSRLRPILNMRPKYRHWLSPSLWQFNADLHLVDWLTEKGFDFDVITDQDLNYEGPELLKPYKAVLTGSHPEYYSGTMLDALETYQRGGGRFMYMGANGFYWIIAYHPSDPNIIEVRKENGSQAWKAKPGERHLSFTGEYGTLWRHRGRAPQKIAGTGFVAEGFDVSSYYRRMPDSFDSRVAFIFEGIGADELLGNFGLVGGGAAGLELDIYDTELGTPPHALLLASSEKHTDVYLEVLEEMYFNAPGVSGTQSARVRGDVVYYTTPNGGAVFSVSSIAFCGSLSHNNYHNNCSRMIQNVLTRFVSEEPLPSLG